MKANHRGELDLTRDPLSEPRLSGSDIVLILTVLLAISPLAYWVIWHGLELARIAEGQ